MHNINKILVSLVLAAASSVALAESNSTNAQVNAAGETTLAKLHEAETLLQNKASNEEVLKVLNDAKQSQKDFRFEKTERARQKFGGKLRLAYDSLKDGKTAEATAALTEATAIFTEMKAFYDSEHK